MQFLKSIVPLDVGHRSVVFYHLAYHNTKGLRDGTAGVR